MHHVEGLSDKNFNTATMNLGRSWFIVLSICMSFVMRIRAITGQTMFRS